jgi:hypothetical protein
MMAVGYGMYNGAPSWILHNSYKRSWGVENGYMRYLMGHGDLCGITEDPNYPLLSVPFQTDSNSNFKVKDFNSFSRKLNKFKNGLI